MCYLSIATANDFKGFYDIRCEQKNIAWTGHTKRPNLEDLHKWYLKQLDSDNRIIYLYKFNQNILGYLYVNTLDEETFEIAYAISESFEGKGYGRKMIDEFIKNMNPKNLIAYISECNIASQKMLTKVGFKKEEEYYINELPLISKKPTKFFKWSFNDDNRKSF